jgi:hypothetical protein
MRAKYSIQDCDFYNFDETSFMMGVITSALVVTRADRRGRGKAVQPGNREWATAIVCINGEGRRIPPFLVVQGKCYLSSWYTKLLHIKQPPNQYTDGEPGRIPRVLWLLPTLLSGVGFGSRWLLLVLRASSSRCLGVSLESWYIFEIPSIDQLLAFT